jgi:hypothetical protein
MAPGAVQAINSFALAGEEAVSEGARLLVSTALGEVALDDGDLDLGDARSVSNMLVEEAKERGGVALHAWTSSV